MSSLKLISAYLKKAKEIKESNLPDGEKLFLVSAIWFNSYYLIEPRVKGSSSAMNKKQLLYDKEISQYVLSRCGKKLSIKVVKDIKECIKNYYNCLSKVEKEESIHSLNKLAKIFLVKSRCNDDVFRNVYNLMIFFEDMYYATNGDFKYDENIFYLLLKTNRYKKSKMFFNALAYNIISLEDSNIIEKDKYLILASYMQNILREISIDFNVAMAKAMLKLKSFKA